MSIDLVRMRFAAVAARIETTAGTDAIGGTPAAADWLAAECEIDFDPVVVENPELTGSLDRSPGIVGGLRPRIRLRIPLRGSGSAATAPEWGRLMRCCTFAETTNAALAATALPATGHSTTSVTLPTTPYGNTAQQYRGQPLVLTGAVADGRCLADCDFRSTADSLLECGVVWHWRESRFSSRLPCWPHCYGQRGLGRARRLATPPANVENSCLEALAHQAVNPARKLERMLTSQRCRLCDDDVDNSIMEIVSCVPARAGLMNSAGQVLEQQPVGARRGAARRLRHLLTQRTARSYRVSTEFGLHRIWGDGAR